MKNIKTFISDLMVILLMIIGLLFGILFVYGVMNEKANLEECESKGLGLIYPPLESFQWINTYYCGNVTELNKTHEMKQAPISKWWYWDK